MWVMAGGGTRWWMKVDRGCLVFMASASLCVNGSLTFSSQPVNSVSGEGKTLIQLEWALIYFQLEEDDLPFLFQKHWVWTIWQIFSFFFSLCSVFLSAAVPWCWKGEFYFENGNIPISKHLYLFSPYRWFWFISLAQTRVHRGSMGCANSASAVVSQANSEYQGNQREQIHLIHESHRT